MVRVDFGVVEHRLPARARVGLISAWGTGMGDARYLLDAVLRLEPAVLIHLGDIYYAGTPREDELHFAGVLNAAFQKLGHRIAVSHHPRFSAHRWLNGIRWGAPRPHFNSGLHSAVPGPHRRLDVGSRALSGHLSEGLHGASRARLIGCSAFESQTDDDPYEVLYPDAPFHRRRGPCPRHGLSGSEEAAQ